MAKPERAVQEAPRRGVLEEVGNAVTHGIGALLSVAGLVLLLGLMAFVMFNDIRKLF